MNESFHDGYYCPICKRVVTKQEPCSPHPEVHKEELTHLGELYDFLVKNADEIIALRKTKN